MSEPEFGTSFDKSSHEPVDSWSRAVFDALRDWPLAQAGQWTRTSDGWLNLRIEEVDGEKLEPLFAVELDTYEDRILVDFGSWATPISSRSGPLAGEANRASAEARELVEQWLRGEVKLASYSDATGWRGSKVIEGGELPAAIEPVPVELGKGGYVEVKTSRHSEWRYFDDYGNGIWIERREIGDFP